MKDIVFFDTEIDPQSGKVLDIGAVKDGGERLHGSSAVKFAAFSKGTRYFCGHNIIAHDLRYVGGAIRGASPNYVPIDTLPLSPLLFPMKPYHRLLKNDKLQSDELNNPLNDAIKARELFYDEVSAFQRLPFFVRNIFYGLLHDAPEFSGFFDYLDQSAFGNTEMDIRVEFRGQICRQAELGLMMRKTPVELAYTLALIRADDKHSITPPWVIKNYPRMDNVMKLLRGTPCTDKGCEYCRKRLDVRLRLKEIFGFDGFRTYDGEPLQERAAEAAIAGKSLLAVFPTGGGKSVTFQLPALIAGDTSRGLTVVISPLQSLMKDQVDNLEEKGIVDAVTINGLLDPIARKSAIDRVANGMASILYISPESLRSKTIESLLLSRNVVRFVIDEAHCFSAWGQDFRVDYLADRLGVPKEEVIDAVLLMREEGVLADHMDLSARIRRADTQNRSALLLRRFLRLEDYLIENLPSGERLNYKELNDRAVREGIKTSTVRDIKTIVFYWTISGYLRKTYNADDERVLLERAADPEIQRAQKERRAELAAFIVEYLFGKCDAKSAEGTEETLVKFSVTELQRAFNEQLTLRNHPFQATPEDVQKALLYLSKIQALSLEGGFLVSYNSMQLTRLELDNRIQYKREDYRALNAFYKQRMQQIHIVGEYAHLMVRDYDEALQFVSDYFQMDYKAFLKKYFKGNRFEEINRNITPAKYDKLFGALSPIQREIIDDDSSQYIVVAAGPGSGKTRVLVHKLASLLMLEDVKHEQLLMLTFSRAAATEFKKRLIDLIGNAAHFVEIKTFHSYCFDLLGKIGNLEDAADVVQKAANRIESGEVEPERITKSVLVIDEAQDMDAHEFALVRALMRQNENMRVIAVGDDDQNIYAFRGSDSRYMASFLTDYGARRYELLDNYRSRQGVVALANAFAETIGKRMKTAPIHSVSTEQGSVTVTKYLQTHNLETPLVARLKAENASGSRCVLTATNDQALRVMGLLTRHGIKARLIQSNDGFDLYDLAEMRFFLKRLGDSAQSPILDDELWEQAKEKLSEQYKDSACLPLCVRMLDVFAGVSKRKYRSDFLEFLHESKIEDFIKVFGETVLVSTIHKSKGREFDAVYLMLSDYDLSTDAAKRALYVGMTRAKSALRIHTNMTYFDCFDLPALERAVDTNEYGEPDELLLQLTHRDVVLDYFKSRKDAVLALRSGDTLLLNGDYLKTAELSSQRIVKLSRSCRDRLAGLSEKGYTVSFARVRFVVAWKGADDEEETAIVLPDLYLRRGD